MGSGVSGPKAVILHRDGFTAGLSLPSCIHICPASQNRERRPRSHHPASKSATLSKQGPQPTAHLTVNSVPGGQGAEGKKMDDSPPEIGETWTSLLSARRPALLLGKSPLFLSLGLVINMGQGWLQSVISSGTSLTLTSSWPQ